MTPGALLVALALAATDAPPAPDPAPVPAPAPAPAQPTAPASAAPAASSTIAVPLLPPEAGRPDHRGWRHSLGLGIHSTTFTSKEGSQYTFHSAALGYHGSVGARGPFLDASWLLPLQARQDGESYATGDYYSTRSGGDLLFGWQWRWTARGTVEAEAGPGLHATLIYLPGRPGYRDFSALPLGLGAGGFLWWRTGHERLSRTVTLGAYASAAYDFYDPAHADDLEHGLTVRAGVAIGLGGRR